MSCSVAGRLIFLQNFLLKIGSDFAASSARFAYFGARNLFASFANSAGERNTLAVMSSSAASFAIGASHKAAALAIDANSATFATWTNTSSLWRVRLSCYSIGKRSRLCLCGTKAGGVILLCHTQFYYTKFALPFAWQILGIMPRKMISSIYEYDKEQLL